jgi:hypothetical protein
MSKVQFEVYSSVNPTNDTAVAEHDAIYIGTGGNIAIKASSTSAAVVFTVPNGSLLPVKAWSIQSTSTTATGIILVKDA